MSEIEKQLAQVRPRIDEISPIGAKTILGFSVFNILLGLSLFSLHSQFSGDIALISYLFNYQFWGLLFFTSGLIMLYTYAKNDWQGMRRMLAFMIFSKTLWLIALIFRLLGGSNSNMILLLIWGLITYLQFIVYINFLPRPPKVDQNG